MSINERITVMIPMADILLQLPLHIVHMLSSGKVINQVLVSIIEIDVHIRIRKMFSQIAMPRRNSDLSPRQPSTHVYAFSVSA
jgi:hypothetical protein